MEKLEVYINNDGRITISKDWKEERGTFTAQIGIEDERIVQGLLNANRVLDSHYNKVLSGE